jgi:hypothetical protein
MTLRVGNNKKISLKQKVANYIENTKRPFCVKQVMSDTGAAYGTAKAYLLDFKEKGKIKKIGTQGNMAIFVRVKEDWKNREAVKDRKLKFYKEFYQSMKDFMSQAETKRVYYDSDN